jgi:hypothetical protein
MGQAVQVRTKKDGAVVRDTNGVVVAAKDAEPFYALERSNYGIVHVRSDGQRFLVTRHGSGVEKKEAYAYRSLGASRFVADKVRRI